MIVFFSKNEYKNIKMNTKTKQYRDNRFNKSKQDIVMILMEEGYGTQYSKKIKITPYTNNNFNIKNIVNIREEKV